MRRQWTKGCGTESSLSAHVLLSVSSNAAHSITAQFGSEMGYNQMLTGITWLTEKTKEAVHGAVILIIYIKNE